MSTRRDLRVFLLLILLSVACGGEQTAEVSTEASFYKPQEALGELFHDVQMARVFPDSKTFVDCRPLGDPSDILADYRATKDQPGFDLSEFVQASFHVPEPINLAEYQYPDSIQKHIPAYWEQLVREPGEVDSWSTLIPLPNAYVVPGGRFREIYYWDSYFTMQGLARSGRYDLIENMLDNFAFLIDTVGFIPNGNRTYFLSRSQPPFFAPMVSLMMENKGMYAVDKYLPQLIKEHDFWMNGAETLSPENREYRRVVMMEDGSVMNRYYDDDPSPRPESYLEDVELAHGLDSVTRVNLYRNIRAACESGWDFSTRWFADNTTLATIETTDIIPVDLNSLLLHLESMIALLSEKAGDMEQSNAYYELAGDRAASIKKYLWDTEKGYYQDFNYKKAAFTDRLTLAGMYPFYFDIADREQIGPALEVLENNFMKGGGVVTTLVNSGQQWDAPNGWAPLQWITIIGLSKYDHAAMANTLAERWLQVNQKVYANTNKMMEKYNVEDLTLEAGGGEYPTQDGFGWTNGVAYALLSLTGNLEVDE